MIAPRRRRTAPFRYLLFNKPFQVLTQFTPGSTPPGTGSERRTLSEFISAPGVYPVGRLDFDSEGLLLLTDDGELQHRLTDPAYRHPRMYWVQVEGAVTPDAVEALRRGVVIQGYRTEPCTARAIAEPKLWPRDPPIRQRAAIPTAWLELTLTEGRNRQVRRMTAAVGLPTLRLVRCAIGGVRVTGLLPGQSRELTTEELQSLQRWRVPPPRRQRQ